MDPYNENHISRLSKSLENSYRQLRPFRRLNEALVEQYAGSAYGSESKPKFTTAINLLHQAVEAYIMSLAANRPQILVTTDHPELQPFGLKFQTATNNLLTEIGIEHTFRQWILDAFFCVGIIKVHLQDAGEVQVETDQWMDPGTPFASNVSIDNFVYDTSARKFEQARFVGNMYRMPFEDFQSAGIFDEDETKKHRPFSAMSDSGEERVEYLSGGYEGTSESDQFEEMIDLVDIWIPRTEKILTYVVNSQANLTIKGNPVGVEDWDGPEFGPYHMLGFNTVPDNVMPVSPASHLSYLDKLINNLMRKQSKRARNHKIQHLYTPGGAATAKNMQQESDDAWLMSDDPSQVQSHETGGVDQRTQMYIQDSMELFDRMGGNLQALLGLGAQSGTVGQEKLIHGASSKKIEAMSTTFVGAATRVARDLSYLLWNDEFKVIRGTYTIPGAENYPQDHTWTPADREGDFYDFNFNIDLYSLTYQTPTDRVETLHSLLERFYGPFQEQLQQQGGFIDMQEATEVFAEMLRLPRLKKMVKFLAPPVDNGKPGPATSLTQNPHTSRTQIRHNVPTGGTEGSQSQGRRDAWAASSQGGGQQALPVPN